MSVAAHLRQLGVKTNAEQIFGSADAGAEMLARELIRNPRFWWWVPPTCANALQFAAWKLSNPMPMNR